MHAWLPLPTVLFSLTEVKPEVLARVFVTSVQVVTYTLVSSQQWTIAPDNRFKVWGQQNRLAPENVTPSQL